MRPPLRLAARTVAALASAATIAPSALAAQQREAPPAPGTPRDFSLPPTRELSLPNGLEVTLVPYGVIPKATFRLVVRTGNIDETAEQVWLADLTGDLMQEGSTTRTAARIAEEAAAMGGALQVAVGPDVTTFGGEVLSQFAPDFVRLAADVVRNPAFPASELPRLKAARMRQISIARRQPQSIALERFRAALYPGHPYGRIYPDSQALSGYTVEQIRAFHGAQYGAARSHIYVVGRYDERAVERAIREAFGDWQRGTAARLDPPTPTSARVIHIVDRPKAVQSTIYMGLPVIDPSSPDYVAMLVTNSLLGGSFGSRITSNIRERKGYTYSPSSTVSSRYRDAYWAEVADVTTNVTGASLTEILHEIDSLRAVPPSAEELRGIQNYLAGTFVLQNSSRMGIISVLQMVDLHGLGDDYLTEFVRRVYAVSPADVQRIARTHLAPERMTIVVVGDREVIADQLKPFGGTAR
jgi:predicted Zn-dependent peptidase